MRDKDRDTYLFVYDISHSQHQQFYITTDFRKKHMYRKGDSFHLKRIKISVNSSISKLS